MAVERSTFLLDETQIPTQWYNIIPDLPAPPPPPLHPGTPAGRARRPGPAVPDGADRAGGHDRVATSTSPAGSSTSTGCGGRRRSSGPAGSRGALDTPAQDLLQVRGRHPGRLAQAEHRRPAGLLQPRGRRPPADHRDRCRPVGHRARLRLRAVRASSARSGRSGRPTTRSRTGGHDGDLGGDVHPTPRELTEAGRRILAEHPDTPARSASPSPRRSRPPSSREDTRYALGSVLNHVLLHQTVIGEEALLQFARPARRPT